MNQHFQIRKKFIKNVKESTRDYKNNNFGAKFGFWFVAKENDSVPCAKELSYVNYDQTLSALLKIRAEIQFQLSQQQTRNKADEKGLFGKYYILSNKWTYSR